jgi:hypothetical protein
MGKRVEADVFDLEEPIGMEEATLRRNGNIRRIGAAAACIGFHTFH